jgi:FMN reductase
MSALSIVGVSGSLSRPSRTSNLVSAVLDSVAQQREADVQLFDLFDLSTGFFSGGYYDKLPESHRQVIDDIENADLLVVGTPVYRGSYSGAFKHLFDLVRYDKLKGKPVILTATGGTPLHGLVTEHQLRPLFGFFGSLTLPTTIYALESDFENHALASDTIRQRIKLATEDALHALAPRRPLIVQKPAALAATANV